MDLEKEILRLLAEDGRLTASDIAERLNISAAAAAECVCKLESNGIITGYRATFDETLLPENAVKAIIEVKTKPERDGGFDRIAKKISKFSKVESVYLVSGGSDLLQEVKGENLKDIAEFVAGKLSTIDGVTSTSTHFILKKYKDLGKMMQDDECRERLSVAP